MCAFWAVRILRCAHSLVQNHWEKFPNEFELWNSNVFGAGWFFLGARKARCTAQCALCRVSSLAPCAAARIYSFLIKCFRNGDMATLTRCVHPRLACSHQGSTSGLLVTSRCSRLLLTCSCSARKDSCSRLTEASCSSRKTFSCSLHACRVASSRGASMYPWKLLARWATR